MKPKRIWELDAFRGICILGVLAVHLVYDMTQLYDILEWEYPVWFSFIKDWGGILFLLISGISATLGSRSVRRGLIVLGCGLVITAVTYGLYRYADFHKSILIYFGVLHCLGICMILWGLAKYLPTWALAILGVAIAAVGLYLEKQLYTDLPQWLMVFGFRYRGLMTSDYFPLMPHFGFFLIGAVLGRLVYAKKVTLLPMVNEKNFVIRFFTACGRHSLWIYLIHQPVFAGVLTLISQWRNQT